MNKYLDTLTDSDVRSHLSRDDGPEIILGHVRHIRESFRADATTEGGRKAIISFAYKLGKFNSRMDKERKAFTEDLRKSVAEINARGKQISEGLKEIQAEVRKPVTEFEQREKARVEALKARVGVFIWAESNAQGMELEELREYVQTLRDIDATADDWQEFGDEAREAKATAMPKVEAMLETLEQRERDRLELERLRAEQAELKRQREIAEAAERARQEAERQAQVNLEAERRRAEEERIAVERKAEAVRLEAEQKAQAVIEAVKREREEAEARARQAEQEKQAALEWAEASVEPSGPEPEPGVADIAELADKPCPSKLAEIREDILADIVCLSASQIADKIMAGKVRHVRVVS